MRELIAAALLASAAAALGVSGSLEADADANANADAGASDEATTSPEAAPPLAVAAAAAATAVATAAVDASMSGNQTVQQPANILRYTYTTSVIVTIAYAIVFVVGIIGNSFVVAIVCKSPRMRTVTNYFIANLAFADILVLLCLPATLVNNLFIREYRFGLSSLLAAGRDLQLARA